MRNILLTIQILLILASCNPQDGSNRTTDLKIQEPKLSELTSSNAIEITKEHLTRLNVPIDSMYLIGIDSTNKQLWEIRVIHYNNFLIQAEYEKEKKRIDSLEQAGITEYTLNFIPPTGNWGGYDRTLIYSTTERRITADLMDQ
ncbi:MAG: hypothetical protein ABJ004_00295 [Cyclobacteriaceae bacterium]